MEGNKSETPARFLSRRKGCSFVEDDGQAHHEHHTPAVKLAAPAPQLNVIAQRHNWSARLSQYVQFVQ